MFKNFWDLYISKVFYYRLKWEFLDIYIVFFIIYVIMFWDFEGIIRVIIKM